MKQRMLEQRQKRDRVAGPQRRLDRKPHQDRRRRSRQTACRRNRRRRCRIGAARWRRGARVRGRSVTSAAVRSGTSIARRSADAIASASSRSLRRLDQGNTVERAGEPARRRERRARAPRPRSSRPGASACPTSSIRAAERGDSSADVDDFAAIDTRAAEAASSVPSAGGRGSMAGRLARPIASQLVGVDRPVEPRQDDRALRQAADGLQAARRSRGSSRSSRRRSPGLGSIRAARRLASARICASRYVAGFERSTASR